MKKRTSLSTVLKFQVAFFLILFSNKQLLSQKSIRSELLMGEWQVIKWQPLTHYKADNIQGKSAFYSDSMKCINSIINISDHGMYIKPINQCDFDNYTEKIVFCKVINLIVVPESEESRQHPGLEIDSGMISTTLCRLLNFTGPSLKMAVTNYNIDWGANSKLRIFILKTNLIAFFRGGDILILKRLKK